MAQAKIKMIPGRKAGITSLPAFNAPQASAATFIVGAPVKLTSGKLAAVSTTNAASSTTTFVKKSSTTNILGISMGKAVASSGANLVVARIHEGMEFIGNLVHATASSAKVSKIGNTVYLGKDKSSDTHWGWSLSAPGASSTSYVAGKITGLVDPASTVNGRVLVTITKGGALAV
jgi:hypothetical protein